MLVGYVSDENDVAIADVAVELSAARSGGVPVGCRSSASGRVDADVAPGRYEVVLARDGYGPKRTTVVAGGEPVRLRLLSDRTYGFVWPKEATAGDTAEIRVSCPLPYRLSLGRYGSTRERVASRGVGEHEPGATAVPLPDGDIAGSGVDWSPGEFPGQRVVAPERGGLYFVHVDDDGGGFHGLPWIVSPSVPTAPVAVLAGDLTWAAYNSFGGRSNYLNPAGLPPAPAVSRRQDLAFYATPERGEWEDEHYPPLSLRRPDPDASIPLAEDVDGPTTTRPGPHLAAADWRLLAWLERQGIEHDLYAESRLARGEVPLDAYRVLVLGCHPEYWTYGMFQQVRDWVHAGGRLLHLGGNGLNCEVELLDDDRLLVHNGDTRTLGPGDGPDWSRFTARREPEAALLGVGYDQRGLLTAAPYEVVEPSHWAFAGTGLAAGDLFGRESLNGRILGGASGHETDKISPHSPPGTTLLARGVNANGSGAHLVHVPALGRGEVVSAGSIAFVMSLLVDDVVSALTRNVLDRVLAAP